VWQFAKEARTEADHGFYTGHHAMGNELAEKRSQMRSFGVLPPEAGSIVNITRATLQGRIALSVSVLFTHAKYKNRRRSSPQINWWNCMELRRM